MAEEHPTFSHASFGNTGQTVFRLGLSGSYWPGKRAIHYALDHGVNFFFAYGIDGQTVRTLRDVFKTNRQNIILATGAYNLVWGYPNLRRTLEKRLRQFGTDYIDAFLFLGVLKPKQCPPKIFEELARFREEGKVRTIGISGHDRKFAGQLAEDGVADSLMIRYNAAHRGAEEDIFPHLSKHNPGIISYTATRWGYLIRKQKGWPKDRPIPTPGQCYRFVLSNENVDVCLTAPMNLKQLKENLTAIEAGPLSADEMTLLRDYGDLVHYRKKYFM